MRLQPRNQTREVPSHLVATWEVIQALVSDKQMIRMNQILMPNFPRRQKSRRCATRK